MQGTIDERIIVTGGQSLARKIMADFSFTHNAFPMPL